jgi:hypothetical protein
VWAIYLYDSGQSIFLDPGQYILLDPGQYILLGPVKIDLAYGQYRHRQGAHTQPSPEEEKFNTKAMPYRGREQNIRFRH